ncbi:YybS family protein [Sporosarcina sp. E16_8]|uniref:YybS family protein n=1 Tax=Sporosarcina sp. E16_8 TaxID=2789295 RepID=UPI001A91D9E2|nr:YybS family protein [Sporosarcina sp. E16_8]MBO0587546.1 YybS family protein [Sporosarcina sp. E16_8]
MQDNARKITYGAMMIAFFAILLAVSLYTPLLGSVTMFFIPLPIILYRLKYDRTSSFLVYATGVVLSLLIGGILLVPFAIVHGILGFIIGETIMMGKTRLYIFMASGLTLLITGMVVYVGAVLFFGFNMIDELMTAMQDSKEQMTSFMSKIGGLPANYDEVVTSSLQVYEYTIPSIFIIGAFMLAFILLTLNLGVAKRIGFEVPKFPPFREMKLPMITVVLYGAILLIQLFADVVPGTNLYLVIVNATTVLRFLLLLQGVSLIHYYVNEMKLPKVATVVATIFALVLAPITTMLGILDTGVNLRAWLRKDKSK